MKLKNERHERFCNEYIIDLNGTQAAIRAGYSEKTAAAQSARLLRNVNIQNRISELQAERSKRTEITQDMVLKELAHIAFDDIGNYLEFKTEQVPVKVLDMILTEYRTIVDLKDSKGINTKNIQEVSIGKDGQFKFKLYNRMDALKALGEHLGLFKGDASGKEDEALEKLDQILKITEVEANEP